MVRGPSAYFIFCAEKREEAKAHLAAAAGPGAKVSVTAVAKQLGVLWKALSDDAKQRYKDLAKEKAEALSAQETEATVAVETDVDEDAAQASALDADGGGDGRDGQGDGDSGVDVAIGDRPMEEADLPADGAAAQGAGKAAAPQHFPISIVRKIMCLDDDVQRVSSGAVRATGWAAELFIQNLAVKALQLARKAKRKNLKFSDIEQAVRSDRRCVDMCLKEVLCTEATFAQARGELPDDKDADEGTAGKENNGAQAERKSGKASKANAPPKDLAGVRQISTFFKT